MQPGRPLVINANSLSTGSDMRVRANIEYPLTRFTAVHGRRFAYRRDLESVIRGTNANKPARGENRLSGQLIYMLIFFFFFSYACH